MLCKVKEVWKKNYIYIISYIYILYYYIYHYIYILYIHIIILKGERNMNGVDESVMCLGNINGNVGRQT